MTELPPSGQPAAAPAAPPPVRRAVETSGSAIASLVFGLLAFCTAGIAGIPGIICGLFGLRRVRRGGGLVRGRGLAIAGIVALAVAILLWIALAALLLLFSFVAYRGAFHQGPRHMFMPTVRAPASQMAAQSMIGMKVLAAAALEYAEAHGGRLPPANEYPGALRQYLDPDETPAPPQGRAFAMNASLAGVRLADIPKPERTVLLFETHAGGRQAGKRELLRRLAGSDDAYAIAFADGHVEWVPAENIDDLIWDIEKVEAALRL